jgi:hypothetical protein
LVNGKLSGIISKTDVVKVLSELRNQTWNFLNMVAIFVAFLSDTYLVLNKWNSYKNYLGR